MFLARGSGSTFKVMTILLELVPVVVWKLCGMVKLALCTCVTFAI